MTDLIDETTSVLPHVDCLHKSRATASKASSETPQKFRLKNTNA